MVDKLHTRPFPAEGNIAVEKKKRLWRNLFLLNLGISIMLVGIFWLPAKLIQMEEFFSSPSVNLPQKGEVAKSQASVQTESFANLLPTHVITVNASSEDQWTYFDFSRGTAVQIHDPSSLEWDLAFRRGKVISNGGATNKFGKAGFVDLKVTKFDSVSEVPLEEYVQDVTTKTETENPVLLSWYKYNYFTHKLTPKQNVYAVRTADNKYAKVQFLSFYCENKETGCIQMQYVYQDNGSGSFLKNSAGFASPATVASNPAT